MKKIYVASSWRNQYQPQIVAALREAGHEVYDFRNPPNGSGGFAWSDIDKDWEQWDTEAYTKALRHPIAIDGFNSDFDGMKWADCCVMVLPCGRSANTECGWMKGAGKPCFVFSPIKQEPELMYKVYDGVFDDIKKLLTSLSLLSTNPAGISEINWTRATPDYHEREVLAVNDKKDFIVGHLFMVDADIMANSDDQELHNVTHYIPISELIKTLP